MNGNTSLSTAAASSGGAFSLVILINYYLNLKGIQLPGEVLTALTSLIAYVVHYLVAIKIIPGLPSDPVVPVVAPVVPVTKTEPTV